MTLLEKILRRQHSNKCIHPSFKSYLSSSRNSDGRFVLEKNDLRLVIFKDHDRFGRTMLYDSHRCEGKEPSDKQLLGEMMFGNQVMMKKVNSLIKVHILKDPSQLLIAKVFIPSMTSTQENDCRRMCGSFDWYCFHDLPQNDLLASSTSLPVPLLRDDLNKSYDASNNGSNTPYKATLSRWCAMRNDDETSLTSSLAIPNTSTAVRVCKSMLACDHDESFLIQSIPLSQRPVKLGIGLLFRVPENEFAAEFMRKFFFSHLNILESFIFKLKDVIQDLKFLEQLKHCRAECIHDFFQESTESLIQSLLNFYSFPRIQNPVWLNLSLPFLYTSSSPSPSTSSSSPTLSSPSPTSPSPSSSSSLAGLSFMKEFVFLSDKCYTRNTKFFLGSLLTAVLTHHLSWVTPLSQVHSSSSSPCQPPVNPLLAQLRDLYGAVGFPRCISKTVVVGRRVELVNKFLFVLSYFIRCNDLLEASDDDEVSTLGCRSTVSSFVAESETSKDSGFGDNDDGKPWRCRMKKYDNTFQMPSYEKSPSESSSCHPLRSEVNFESFHDDGVKPAHSRVSGLCKVYLSGGKTKLVKTGDHSVDEDFRSILPTPKDDDEGHESISFTTSVSESNRNVSREESQLQRTSPPVNLLTNDDIVMKKIFARPELNFDVEESLYEIMEEIYSDGSSDRPVKIEEMKCHDSSSSSVESSLDLKHFDENFAKENSSDLCTLDMDEPASLPDGPIRQQLKFKLDLIGTATSVDVSSEPEEVTDKHSLRDSEVKEFTYLNLLDENDPSEDSYKLLPEDSNLGRSLLGGSCKSFTPEFVLHGTSDRSFLSPPYSSLHRDLKISLESRILNEAADAALYIVADIDNWTVQLFSLKSLSPDEPLSPQPITSSQLVLRLIESTFELSKFNSSIHIWLSLVEDQLNDIFMKSKVLAEFIQIHGQFCSQQLARVLGYDVSDLPLLLAVAGIHSPKILPSLISPQKYF